MQLTITWQIKIRVCSFVQPNFKISITMTRCDSLAKLRRVQQQGGTGPSVLDSLSV